MSSPLFPLLIACAMLVANGFFVVAEFALVKIRPTRLEELRNAGSKRAALAFQMVQNLDRYLSATQLGVTLASLGLGYVGEPAFHWLIDPFLPNWDPSIRHQVSLSISFVFFSAFHIILGELIPKSIAIRITEKVLFAIVVPLKIFYITFYPFLWVMRGMSGLVLKMFKLPVVSYGHAATEQELRLIVEDSIETGAIGPIGEEKKEILTSFFQFSEKRVRDIMVAVGQADCFYLDRPVEENFKVAHDTMHTRYPLFDTINGSLLGFIHIKDIIWCLNEPQLINLVDISRPIVIFKDTRRIDQALREFKKSRTHIAAVVDAAGTVVGFVTMEDVLEELVGNIRDEYDGTDD